MTELVFEGVSQFVGADFDPLWLSVKGQGIGIKMRKMGLSHRRRCRTPTTLSCCKPIVCHGATAGRVFQQSRSNTTQFDIATATQSCTLLYAASSNVMVLVFSVSDLRVN